MTFDHALDELRSFWKGPLPFGRGSPAEVTRIEKELGHSLPEPLRRYIGELLGPDPIKFEAVGSPVRLWGAKQLGSRLLGYNVHGITGEPLPEWRPNWFLFADEEADPIILDLHDSTRDEKSWTVSSAMHGAGTWEFHAHADSLPQFLLMIAALHHALTSFVPSRQAIEHDGGEFRLIEPAASWLFPRFLRWAPDRAHQWLSFFANFQEAVG